MSYAMKKRFHKSDNSGNHFETIGVKGLQSSVRRPSALRKAMEREAPYLAIRNIKLYCDAKHNKLSDNELVVKHHVSKNTAPQIVRKLQASINRWKKYGEDK